MIKTSSTHPIEVAFVPSELVRVRVRSGRRSPPASTRPPPRPQVGARPRRRPRPHPAVVCDRCRRLPSWSRTNSIAWEFATIGGAPSGTASSSSSVRSRTRASLLPMRSLASPTISRSGSSRQAGRRSLPGWAGSQRARDGGRPHRARAESARAIEAVRACRPGAIETPAQERMLYHLTDPSAEQAAVLGRAREWIGRLRLAPAGLVWVPGYLPGSRRS